MSAFQEAAEDALVGEVERAYAPNRVPGKPTYPYLVVSVSADRPAAYTNDATHGVRWHRLTVQSFGKTVESALALDAAAGDVFLDKRLVVEGWDCGPMTGDQPGALFGALTRDPDDNGVVSVTSTLPFAATKE